MIIDYSKNKFLFCMVDKIKDLFATFFLEEIIKYPAFINQTMRSIFGNGYCGFYALCMGHILSYIISECSLENEFCVVYPRTQEHITTMLIMQSSKQVAEKTMKDIKITNDFMIFDAMDSFGPFTDIDIKFGIKEYTIAYIDNMSFEFYPDENIEEIYGDYVKPLYYNEYPNAVYSMKTIISVVENKIIDEIAQYIENYKSFSGSMGTI